MQYCMHDANVQLIIPSFMKQPQYNETAMKVKISRVYLYHQITHTHLNIITVSKLLYFTAERVRLWGCSPT